MYDKDTYPFKKKMMQAKSVFRIAAETYFRKKLHFRNLAILTEKSFLINKTGVEFLSSFHNPPPSPLPPKKSK